jgi:hypothetical protein
VSLWEFSCKNATSGCLYKHPFYSQVLEHQRTCKFISTEVLAESNKVKASPCDRDRCRKGFNTNTRLKGHIPDVYDWKPRACNKNCCDPSVVFELRNEYSRHVEKVHSPYTSTTCQYLGCTSQVTFATSHTYRSHLLSAHDLSDRKGKDKYMPREKPAFVPQKFWLPGSSMKGLFR